MAVFLTVENIQPTEVLLDGKNGKGEDGRGNHFSGNAGGHVCQGKVKALELSQGLTTGTHYSEHGGQTPALELNLARWPCL